MARRKRDYYVVLGVERDATETDLKKSFRELARKHHPDVDPTDQGEKFREINEAYAVLSDKDSRARYDRWGHADDSGSSGFSAVVDAAQEMINDVLRRRRGSTKQKGGDLRYTLELTFEEAAFGCSKTIKVPEPATGSSSTAPRAARERDFTVVIPPGSSEGNVKTIKGAGEGGKHGGPTGDLLVMVRVAEHATFRREGIDVRSEVAISFTQAALGAIVDVKTLDGEVKMRVPEGTQPGAVFRIRARGIPQSAGKTATRGDHLVLVQLTVPTELTPRQRELLEELARATGESRGDDKAPRKRLLDRVRSLLDE